LNNDVDNLTIAEYDKHVNYQNETSPTTSSNICENNGNTLFLKNIYTNI